MFICLMFKYILQYLNMNKCVFLDRDGVINKDYVDYVYTIEKFQLLEGVVESLQNLKKAGYKLVIVTNQSGIVKGIYNKEDVYLIYEHIQKLCGGLIDEMYYAQLHENFSRSLMRKPDSMMIEKGLAKYNVVPENSWMIGDKETDMIPAVKLGVNTILLSENKKSTNAQYISTSLFEASKIILNT